jgi:hypothetical protein
MLRKRAEESIRNFSQDKSTCSAFPGTSRHGATEAAAGWVRSAAKSETSSGLVNACGWWFQAGGLTLGRTLWGRAYRKHTPHPDRSRSGGIISRERATGLEPATSSLGSWHSTTELRPRNASKSEDRSRESQAPTCPSTPRGSSGDRARSPPAPRVTRCRACPRASTAPGRRPARTGGRTNPR